MFVGRPAVTLVLLLAAFLGAAPLRVCAEGGHAKVLVAGEAFHEHGDDDHASHGHASHGHASHEHACRHAQHGGACRHAHGPTHRHGHAHGPADHDGEAPTPGDHCHCADAPLQVSQDLTPVQLEAPAIAFVLPTQSSVLEPAFVAPEVASVPRGPPLLPALIGSTVLLR